MPTSTTNATAIVARKITPAEVHQQAHNFATASAEWIATYWLQIIIAGAVGTAIYAVLHFLRSLGSRLCAKVDGPFGWGTIFGRAVVRTGNFFIAMLAAKLVTGYAGAPPEIASTIKFLFTVAAVFQSAIWAREIILGAIRHRAQSEHYTGEALGSAMGIIRLLVTIALFAVALIVVLDNLGVNVTGLIAGLGVGGIAIGLAAQGIFADLFAALAIIFDRPFRAGDTIAYDKTSGTVEAIGLKSTRVRSPSGEERIIANKGLLDKEISNYTRREYRRIIFSLGLVQWTSVDVMDGLPAMLKEVVESCGQKFVRAGFTGFGTSSYDFGLEFDSPTPGYKEFYDARHQVGVALIRRLNAEGIELSYPTQTQFTATPDRGIVPPYPAAKCEPGSRDAPPTPRDPGHHADIHGEGE